MTTITVTNLRTYYELAKGPQTGVKQARVTVRGTLPDGLRREGVDPEILTGYIEGVIVEQYNHDAKVSLNRLRDVTYLCLTLHNKYLPTESRPDSVEVYIEEEFSLTLSEFEAFILDTFHAGLEAAQEAAQKAATLANMVKASNELLCSFTEDIDKEAMEACRLKQRIAALQAEFEAEREFQIGKVLAEIQDLTPEALVEVGGPAVSGVFLKLVKNNLVKHAKSRTSGVLDPVLGRPSHVLTLEDLYK